MERSARNVGLKDPGDLWACPEETSCYNTAEKKLEQALID